MLYQDYGFIRIKLAELIEKRGISKNKLAHYAELQRSQINQYCSNQVTRLDTAVLARMCTALDCRIDELLEFVPAMSNDTGMTNGASASNTASPEKTQEPKLPQ